VLARAVAQFKRIPHLDFEKRELLRAQTEALLLSRFEGKCAKSHIDFVCLFGDRLPGCSHRRASGFEP